MVPAISGSLRRRSINNLINTADSPAFLVGEVASHSPSLQIVLHE
jgi:hypothetical protein